jgi:hypothetical protein
VGKCDNPGLVAMQIEQTSKEAGALAWLIANDYNNRMNGMPNGRYRPRLRHLCFEQSRLIMLHFIIVL